MGMSPWKSMPVSSLEEAEGIEAVRGLKADNKAGKMYRNLQPE